MLDTLRKPFLFVSVIALVLVVLIEAGSVAFVTQHVDASAAAIDLPRAGQAIPAMALLDGLLLFVTLVIALGLLEIEQIQSKVQGIVTLVVAILILLAALWLLLKSFMLLVLMVTLLMSPPFGTVAYFALWSHFPTSTARAVLIITMLLKILFFAGLLLAHQGFLKEKAYMLTIATCFVATLLTSFLYGLVPGVLVSIADVVAALIVLVLLILWALVYLIGAVVSVVTVLENTVTG